MQNLSHWNDATEYIEELRHDAERTARETYDDNKVLVIRKSYAEYCKEINLLRARLRYIKKTVGYCRGETSPYGNQRDIIELEHEIKDLCKLRKAAKEMEAAKK